MRKLLSKLAVLLVVALVMGLGVALPAMADPPMENVLTKTLALPEHVTIPANGFAFTFNFARVGNVPPPPALNIPNQTITFEQGFTGTTGPLANTVELEDILNGFRATPGLNAGIQEWVVTEVIPPVADRVPGMTYDQSRFILRVHFSNNLDAQGIPLNPPLNVAAVEVFRTHDRLGAPVTPDADAPGQKGPLAFLNIFAPDVGNDEDPNNAALVVSKTIGDADTRPYANLGTLFPFTITIAAPQYIDPPQNVTQPVLPSPIAAQIMTGAAPGTPAPVIPGRPSSDVSIVNGTADFLLRDGEWLRILVLPAGATYTVTETGVPNFVPNAVVVGGEAPNAYFTATAGQDLTANGVIHNIPVNNRADFTNVYQWSPPQGLVIANMPFFAAAAVLLALALMLTSRSRKRIEEMPIAY